MNIDELLKFVIAVVVFIILFSGASRFIHWFFSAEYDNQIDPKLPSNDGTECVCKFYPGRCLYCHNQLTEDSC